METRGLAISDIVEASISQEFKDKVTLEILSAQAGAYLLSQDFPSAADLRNLLQVERDGPEWRSGHCSGCGRPHNERTPGCHNCGTRHQKRKEAKEKREQPQKCGRLLTDLVTYWHNW